MYVLSVWNVSSFSVLMYLKGLLSLLMHCSAEPTPVKDDVHTLLQFLCAYNISWKEVCVCAVFYCCVVVWVEHESGSAMIEEHWSHLLVFISLPCMPFSMPVPHPLCVLSYLFSRLEFACLLSCNLRRTYCTSTALINTCLPRPDTNQLTPTSLLSFSVSISQSLFHVLSPAHPPNSISQSLYSIFISAISLPLFLPSMILPFMPSLPFRTRFR